MCSEEEEGGEGGGGAWRLSDEGEVLFNGARLVRKMRVKSQLPMQERFRARDVMEVKAE